MAIDNPETGLVETEKYIKSVKLPDGESYTIKAPYAEDVNGGKLNFWSGTKAEYDAIETKDSNTLYNITDDADTSSTVANTDLSNLSTTGQAIIDNKADIDLSNLSEEGEMRLGSNLPLGYHFYQGEGMQPLAGFLPSTGTWERGSLYYGFWKYITEDLSIGDKFAGGYVKDSTDDYDNYDLVINQSDMTFRLPLLDGSEHLWDIPNKQLLPSSSFGTDLVATQNGTLLFTPSVASGESVLVVTLNGKAFSFCQGYSGTDYSHPTGNTFELIKGDVYNLKIQNMNVNFIPYVGTGTLYFKVGNAVTNQELIDIGQVTNSLTNKVDLDGSGAKFPYIIDTYVNDASGYIVWSNGYCEQWGLNTVIGSSTISLLKEFKNENYNVFVSIRCNSGNSWTYNGISFHTQTTTSFILPNSGYIPQFWKACGYLAEGEYSV
jgi:hypothetical protein